MLTFSLENWTELVKELADFIPSTQVGVILWALRAYFSL